MKKILCLMITLSFLLTSVSIAYAKPSNTSSKGKQTKVEQQKTTKKETQQKTVKETQKTTKKVTEQSTTKQKTNSSKVKVKKQTFKINGSSVIKYGKYKLPISPVTKGMGATVNFDKATGVLTVTKDTTTIVIDFAKKIVTVNGVEDTKSGIFTASNSKKTTVLIKYIANKLGVRATVEDDKVIVEVPVDTAAPTITSVSSAALSVSGSALSIAVTGAGAVNDKVDVTKISLLDTATGVTYQLTEASTGLVSSDTLLMINLGAADVLGLSSFGGSTVFLNVAAASLLSDAAGNTSPVFTSAQSVPVTMN